MSKEIDELLRQQDDVVVTLYTEEQMMLCWKESRNSNLIGNNLEDFQSFIQSLKSKKD